MPVGQAWTEITFAAITPGDKKPRDSLPMPLIPKRLPQNPVPPAPGAWLGQADGSRELLQPWRGGRSTARTSPGWFM